MQNTELIRKTLIRYGMTWCKLTHWSGRLLLAFLRLVHSLYELPNRPDELSAFGTLTASCSSYQTGQTGFLWHFYDLLNCKTSNKSDGLFYLLTLDGSTICNQLGLGGDYKYGLYATKILDGIWSTRLVELICRHHSHSFFNAIGGQSFMGMRMTRLTCIVWCQSNETGWRKTYDSGEEGWKIKMTSHM